MISKEAKAKAKELGIENVEDTIEIGSKEQDEWNRILLSTKASISQAERSLELNNHLLPYIEKRIAEEKEKFK